MEVRLSVAPLLDTRETAASVCVFDFWLLVLLLGRVDFPEDSPGGGILPSCSEPRGHHLRRGEHLHRRGGAERRWGGGGRLNRVRGGGGEAAGGGGREEPAA